MQARNSIILFLLGDVCEAESGRQLQECLNGEKQYKDVKVRGKFFVTESNFNVNHSVSILGEKDAMIEGAGENYFLLDVKGGNVNINITNIHFEGIQILKVDQVKESFISIINCTTKNTTGSIVSLKSSNVSNVEVR